MSTVNEINRKLPLTEVTPVAIEAADGVEASTDAQRLSPDSPLDRSPDSLRHDKALSEATSHGSKSGSLY